MKHLFITICALTLSGSAIAQSFLDKKLAKLQEGMNSATYSKSDYEAAAKDSASPFLDGKEIPKDSRNIGGIYYSKTPIYAMTEGDKGKVLKKFLVTYTETESYNNKIMIYNQYSYETTNEAKYVIPATFVSTSNPPSVDIMNSNVAGALYLASSSYDSRKYTYNSTDYKKDIQGNYIANGKTMGNWNNGGMIEIEPGIIILGGSTVYLDDKGNPKKEEFDLQRRFRELTVLYKPGKEAIAAKYTREYMWDKLAEFYKKLKEAGDKAGYRFTLPSPSPIGIVPEHQAMRDAAIKLFEDAAKAKGYPIKVLYVYSYHTGPYYNSIKGIRAIGNVPMQVNIGRSVAFYAVFENLKLGTKQPNPWYAPNKYGYAAIEIGENMRDDLFNINEFTGKFYLTHFPVAMWLDASENAMKYKGK